MPVIPSKATMMKNSKYTISGKTINGNYKKTAQWTKFNALRELGQKRIKNDRAILKMKKECLVRPGLWKCPHCLKEVKRLTCAHTGKPVAKIIAEILEQNPDENDICKLDKLVQDSHDDVMIIVCCDACNSLVDDSKSV